MTRPGKKLILTSIILSGVLFFSRCLDSGTHDPRGKAYAGSASCVSCHREIVKSYGRTPHYHSAAVASLSTIAGSFSPDSNTFVASDTARVVMEVRGGIPYQVLYIRGKETRAERFDIVFGYTKGQTYLYWNNDQLYQLPISWFTNLHSWTSSPGYPDGLPFFGRPVLERCFECHTSYIAPSDPQNVNALSSTSLIAQIDCERCHGPAANHVAYHTEFPADTHARYIVSYRALPRDRKIDLCATCHSGSNNIPLRSLFGFQPGDSLAHFAVSAHVGARTPDVHGDQVALLASSKCFKESNMDCSTCHDPHAGDHHDYTAYARRCQGCHSPDNHNFCKIANDQNLSFIERSCTRCHMPAQASGIIRVKTGEAARDTSVFMVNHLIAVYPEESKKVLSQLRIEHRPGRDRAIVAGIHAIH